MSVCLVCDVCMVCVCEMSGVGVMCIWCVCVCDWCMATGVTGVLMVCVAGVLPCADAASGPVQQARSGSAGVLSDEATRHSAQRHHLWQLQQGQFSQFVIDVFHQSCVHLVNVSVIENPKR